MDLALLQVRDVNPYEIGFWHLWWSIDVERPRGFAFTPAAFASADNLQPGDRVVAIGNPSPGNPMRIPGAGVPPLGAAELTLRSAAGTVLGRDLATLEEVDEWYKDDPYRHEPVSVPLAAPAYRKEDVVYVPLPFVAGALGYTYAWDPENRIAALMSRVVAVAAGPQHNLALRSDGTVWAWGSNQSGQLGDGTTIARPTPVQVTGLADVVAVAAGQYYSLALKSDGTVWAWGQNHDGLLGDGTTTDRLRPVQVLFPTAS